MSALENLYPGHLIINVIVIAAATVALVSALAWIVSLLLERHPAIRHSVLLSALVASLASPLLAAAFVASGISLIAIPLLISDYAIPEPRVHVNLTSSADLPPLTTAADSLPARGPSPDVAGRFSEDLNAAEVATEPFRSIVVAVLLVWFCGAVVSTFALARGAVFLHRLRLSLQPISDADLGGALGEAKHLLNARSSPAVMISRLARTPMAVGFLRPSIVLPIELPSAISALQLRDVLVHELAHIERRDNLIVLLQTMAKTAFWPILFVHLLNRELARAREEICDNHVLASRDAVSYGETLLRLAQLACGVAMPVGTVGILHWRGKLEERIAGFIHGRSKMTRTHPIIAVGALALFLSLSALQCGTTILSAQGGEPKQEAAPPKPGNALSTVMTNIDDTEYKRPSADDLRATATIPADAWGEPVNGLRVAIVMRSPAVDKDGRLCYEIVAEIVSDRDIRFAASLGNVSLAFCKIELVAGNGKQVPQQQGMLVKWRPSLTRFWLKPRERILISPWSTQLVSVKEKGEPMAESKRNPVGPFFNVTPGQYAVSAVIEFGPSMESRGPVTRTRTVLSPAKGEWSGKLETGEVLVALFKDAGGSP